MPTDEYREYMDRIAAPIYDFLEPRGFKKRDYTFNTWTNDGLCHVFDLQMGIKSLEGEFTANLGIYIPETNHGSMYRKPPEFVSVGYCGINARFSEFTGEDDKWWEITPYPGKVVDELIDLIQTWGLPFFIKFPDRQSIIDGLLEFDEKYSVAITPKLDIALMLEHMGKHGEAQKMFLEHYRESSGFKEHIEYLKKVAEKQNWKIIN